MAEEKSLIDWRKEAKAAGVEKVNTLDKEQCKEAIASKKQEGIEPKPEVSDLHERAEKLGLGDVDNMPEEELRVVVEELEVPEPKETAPLPEVAQVVVSPQAALANREQEIYKELAKIEARKTELSGELSKILLEQEGLKVEIPYIDQLKFSKKLDVESKSNKAQALAKQLKELMG